MSKYFTHPDFHELCRKVFEEKDFNWPRDYMKSYDINQCTDARGNTLLHCAVLLRETSTFPFILVDPNIKNVAGQTAVQLTRNTNLAKVFASINLCIDFDKAEAKPNGLDSLFVTISRGDATLGDTSGVEDDGNEGNAHGWTALHCAAVYDRPHIIRALHERFPNLSANFRALTVAIRYGHINCITTLSECFPSIDTSCVLFDTTRYNRPELIPILQKTFPRLDGNELDEDDNCSALAFAASCNKPQCIRALHSCFPSIDPNSSDNRGTTALIAAVKSHMSRDCISALSECFLNIDPNKQDKNGYTALMHAVLQGWSDGVALFASFFPSTDVNMRNDQGKTALMMAVGKNNEECLAALFESFPNIDPNIQDTNGNTALVQATFNFDPDVMIPQLHNFFPNLDPNVQNNCQDTALILMTKYHSSTKSLRQLIDMFPKVDVTLQNKQGQTALAIAISDGNASLVAMFLEYFPDIYPPIGQPSPNLLVLAIKKNHIDVISLLLEHIIQVSQD